MEIRQEDTEMLLGAMPEKEWRAFIHARMRKFEDNSRLESQALEENTRLTREIAASTAEIVDAFTTMRGGYKFLAAIGRWTMPIAKWGSAILAFIVALWAFKNGHYPWDK